MLKCLQGVAGLTKRDIQLVVDGGYHTVESVAYTYVRRPRGASKGMTSTDAHERPKRILEQIKGISEQKATKFLTEGDCGGRYMYDAEGNHG